MIYFTRQEQRIVIFLGIALLLGTGLLLVKRFQPGWAMRLSMGEPDFDVVTDQISPRLKDDGPKQKTELDVADTDDASGFIGPPAPKQVDVSKPAEIPAQERQQDKSDQTSGTGTMVKKPDQKAKININTATKEELDTLPGIGPVMAQRIIDYRQKHNEFVSIDELIAVRGIGDVTLQKLKERVTVEKHDGSK